MNVERLRRFIPSPGRNIPLLSQSRAGSYGVISPEMDNRSLIIRLNIERLRRFISSPGRNIPLLSQSRAGSYGVILPEMDNRSLIDREMKFVKRR